ncbi:MAG: TIGR04438 family Trp-rich protein [Betaproteobacteria bacterium]|nr:TIGR04438 family Trp-rich protein [Betaproteobacteria bacterium]MDE2122052.1 TIGR04438 family Trp-rich protein [Betaproteobacteria bacterium]MDE2187236.1 TIGR04438 family Trp-rich protein [Betaproteobacteria bacterium]MDE2325149.1 TIGR04438 family Trp-rich protein [Betaproteobacteria bacterium]
MWVLVVAIVLLGLKFAAIGPFATLSWWWIAIPLAVVFVWWEIIDPMFAVSQKRAMREMGERKKERNEKARKALGMRSRK